jgi:hypothetical protein
MGIVEIGRSKQKSAYGRRSKREWSRVGLNGS